MWFVGYKNSSMCGRARIREVPFLGGTKRVCAYVMLLLTKHECGDG